MHPRKDQGSNLSQSSNCHGNATPWHLAALKSHLHYSYRAAAGLRLHQSEETMHCCLQRSFQMFFFLHKHVFHTFVFIWAAALEAVWSSASLHVKQVGNLASLKGNRFQVCSQFYFSLDFHLNAVGVLKTNYLRLDRNLEKMFPPGLNAMLVNTGLYSEPKRKIFVKKKSHMSSPASFFPRLQGLYKD